MALDEDAPKDPTSPEPRRLTDEDRAALAHAEHLRNELRASRHRSHESAGADAEHERGA